MKNTQIQKKSRFTAENVATAAFVAAAFLAPAVGMAADISPQLLVVHVNLLKTSIPY